MAEPFSFELVAELLLSDDVPMVVVPRARAISVCWSVMRR